MTALIKRSTVVIRIGAGSPLQDYLIETGAGGVQSARASDVEAARTSRRSCGRSSESMVQGACRGSAGFCKPPGLTSMGSCRRWIAWWRRWSGTWRRGRGPSAADDQAIRDTEIGLGHGLLAGRRLGPGGITENLPHLWSYQVEGWARRFFDGWYDWAIRSRLEPVRAVARMLSERLHNIITSWRNGIRWATASPKKIPDGPLKQADYRRGVAVSTAGSPCVHEGLNVGKILAPLPPEKIFESKKAKVC